MKGIQRNLTIKKRSEDYSFQDQRQCFKYSLSFFIGHPVFMGHPVFIWMICTISELKKKRHFLSIFLIKNLKYDQLNKCKFIIFDCHFPTKMNCRILLKKQSRKKSEFNTFQAKTFSG